MSKSESCKAIVRSIAALAVIGGAVAAVVLWTRNPRVRSGRLIDKCDDALSELEHRSPGLSYELSSLENWA